jgi:hypothetical protein
MSESGSSIILERSKHRIGVDLVAGAIQKTAAIVATDIVAVRGDSAAAVKDICARSSRIQDAVSDLKSAAVPNGPSIIGGVSAESAVADQQRPKTPVNNTAAHSWLATAPACRVAAYSTISDRRITIPFVNNAAPDSRTFDIASERPVVANSTVGYRQRTAVLDAARSSWSRERRVASGIVVYGAVGDRDGPKGIPDSACSFTGEVAVDGTVGDRHCAAIVVDATAVTKGSRRKERGIVKVYKAVTDRQHCVAIRPAVENRAAVSAGGKIIVQSCTTDGQRGVALLTVAKNASASVPGVVPNSAIINSRITVVIEDPAAISIAITDGETSYCYVMAGHYGEDSELSV